MVGEMMTEGYKAAQMRTVETAATLRQRWWARRQQKATSLQPRSRATATRLHQGNDDGQSTVHVSIQF